MRKKSSWIFILVIIQLFLFSSLASANVIPIADAGMAHWAAPQKSPVISTNGDIVRVDFIHYAKSSNAVRPAKNDPGYKLMGVKWLWQEGYVINLASTPGYLSEATVERIIEESANTWDESTGCSKTTNLDLFGGTAINNAAHYGTYDNKNVIEFGPYSGSSGVIAVTSVWYSRASKAILEFDMLFNTGYAWSTDGAANAMDLQNIATHEFGHAVGLSDIYNSSYSEVTMYGYATYGETNKSSLAPPDMTGLQTMYGI